jgi:hypothetical protein
LTIFFLLVDHRVILVGRSTRVKPGLVPLVTDPAPPAPRIDRSGTLGPILLAWAAATGMAEALYNIERIDFTTLAGFPLLVSCGYVAGGMVAGSVTAATMLDRLGDGLWWKSGLVIAAVVLGTASAETIAYGFRTQHGLIASGPAALAAAIFAACIGALCAQIVIRAVQTNTEGCRARGDLLVSLPFAAVVVGAALGVTLNWNLPIEPTWPIWAGAAVVALLWSTMAHLGARAGEEPSRLLSN